MRASRAFTEGLKRMSRAPGLICGIWLAGLVIAAPVSLWLLESIHRFTRDSQYSQVILEGFDTGWYQEYSSSGAGAPESFSPGKVGLGAWLSNLDRWWDGRVFLNEPAILATGIAFVLVWLLLLGGVLEGLREGAPRPRLPTVVADGVARFPIFLRLALITGVGYYLVFRLARWLFPKIHRATLDMTVEKEVLAYNLAGAAVVVLLLVLLRLISDYAKVAIVVERRRGAALALLRGARFLVANPGRAFGIAAFYGVALVALFALYSIAAPGVADSTPLAILAAAALGQLFVVLKLALRIALLGSELALFEVAG
ncbi:MAG: hypothetical protein ACE5GX_14745 [Thermoanaerobaculia bacterium]